MLSFSNYGSVRHESAEKVRTATEILKNRRPDLIVDGEIQADAALCKPDAGEFFPFSTIQGDATVLIFPELNSANIGYKLLKHLGGAQVIGPILAGINLPIHILERNCTVEEIVSMAAIASVDAEVHSCPEVK
jgi:malate dehydrogenase (oxaloacetate-decarboxylating)(NADP+)